MPLYGGIEAGGTKFVCAVGTGPDNIQAEHRFDTTLPGETIEKAIQFFLAQPSVDAIGVASFGPVDPNPSSESYGYITTTPKANWGNTDIVGALQQALNVPIGFDTDVNGAALAEGRWGAAQGLDTFIYITVGTGVGGGAIVNGKMLHGMMHAEMGHMPLPHDWERDPFPGVCPFHGDCLEGMANGPALHARWEVNPRTLGPDHEAWQLEAHYLALGIVNMITVLSPQRIIMGGGVMDQAHLFPLIRQEVQTLLNGYIKMPQILNEIDSYIVPPQLGNQTGVLGAIALAEQAIQSSA